MTVQQCGSCGRLFPYLARGVCSDCLDTREREFHMVRDYVRDHPGVHVSAVAAETGVDEERIVDFLREGRLEFAPAGVEDVVVCEICGRPSAARQCDDCRGRLLQAFQPSSVALPSADDTVSGMRSRHMRGER